MNFRGNIHWGRLESIQIIERPMDLAARVARYRSRRAFRAYPLFRMADDLLFQEECGLSALPWLKRERHEGPWVFCRAAR